MRLPEVTPYRVYIKWLETRDKCRPRNYWKKYLEGYEKTAGVPAIEEPETLEKGYKNKEFIFEIDREATGRLRHLAGKNYVTLNILLQTAWGVMLARYNAVQDVVFGSVVAGRPPEIDGVESMIGLFVNTIPVRLRFDEETRFNELLGYLQQDDVESKAFHYYPLADIQSESMLKHHLIDHIYVLENYPVKEQVERLTAGDNNNVLLKLSNIEAFEQSNYDFNIVIAAESLLTVRFIYNENVYGSGGIRRIAEHFKHVLSQVLTDETRRICALDLLPPGERQEILYKFNDTRVDYPGDKTLHRLFQEQVVETPDRTALVGSWRCTLAVGKGPPPPTDKEEKTVELVHLTYRELNEQSNRLAHRLRERGVKPGTIAAIMVERSLEMIIGILGILKTGGAYLPIDPDTPHHRVHYVLRDSAASILLVGESFEEEEKIFISRLGALWELLPGESCANPEVNLQSTGLAYVMFTSGSTGKPKGVLVEHRNVVRLVKNTNFIEFGEDDCLLPTGAPDFDASTLEIWGPLLNGSTLHPVKKDLLLDIQTLRQIIRKYRITIMWMTSPLFNQVSEVDIDLFKGLRTLLVGGDVLSPPHINRLKERFPGLKVINGYGPTENTTFSTIHFIEREYETTIPIGTPINNSTAYILDKNGCLLPLGVIGELCVGGDGVARGYLNNPELTGEKFRDSPFRKGERVYRTGDLTRFREEGTIEFLGRIDHQIKIRGHRVELGEIENHLLKMDQIKEAVVVALPSTDADDGNCGYDRRLYAYFTADQPLDPAQLKKYLSVHLPAYMVPVHFVQIEKIPLTPNGKVDRRMLLVEVIQTGEKYTAPRNEREQKLADIWSEVLGLGKEKIGIEDNFFDLGGHSLRVTLLAARVHKEFNIKIPLVEIFSAPTIKELSEYIGRTAEDKHISIEAVEKKEYYILSSAQRRLFFLDHFENIGTTYNVPCMLKFKGRLDIESVERTVKRLVERHDTLRTSFELIANKPVQRIHDHVEFKIDVFPMAGKCIEEMIKVFIRPFDLNKAPLMRVAAAELPGEETLVLYDTHHIVSDGVSMEILMKDFKKLFSGQQLELLKIQYKDFSEWQDRLFESGQIREQEEYWLNRFADADKIWRLNLPFDYQRPVNMHYESDRYVFKLGRVETFRFKALITETQTTLYMNLLAVLSILLYKYTGEEDIIIGTGVAGRRHTCLQDIIGFFINLLALRNYPRGSKTYLEFLQEVKTNGINAFENQDFQFEKLIEKLEFGRDFYRNPLFNVSLTVQNFESQQDSGHSTPFIPLRMDHTTMNVDINFLIADMNEEIYFNLDYLAELFKRETMERLAADFLKIIEIVSGNKEIKIRNIELSDAVEKEKLLSQIRQDQVFFERMQEVDFDEIF